MSNLVTGAVPTRKVLRQAVSGRVWERKHTREREKASSVQHLNVNPPPPPQESNKHTNARYVRARKSKLAEIHTYTRFRNDSGTFIVLSVVDEMCSFFFPAAQRQTSGFDGLRGIPSRGCALQLDIVEEMAGGHQAARNREAGRRKDGTDL